MFLFTFIFSVISSLFGIALNLLLLPLRLIGIPIAIVLMPFKMILRFFARHTVLSLAIILIIFTIVHFSHNRSDLPQLTPAPAQENGKPVPIVEPVRKKEDGDSDFATDLYAIMSDPERNLYSQHFYAAMNRMKDGQIYNWSYYNINGSIQPRDTFQNKSGVTCRHFGEGLKVHTIQQTITGTACAQGNGSWCKLKANATPACNLGGDGPGFFDSISRSLGNLF